MALIGSLLVIPVAQSAPVSSVKDTGAGSTIRVVLAASREAKLSAQIEGRLVSLPKGVGASFRKGDLLAEFDCVGLRAELAMAAARREKAQKTLESKQALGALNAVSDLELGLAQADMAEATARERQADANVRHCRILAPYAGRVVRKLANEYETISPGAPVLEIVETGALRLELLVPSRWLAWLKTGTTFSVHVDELGRDVPARVTAIGSRVDAVSQTVSIQGVITESVSGVLPGMSGNAVFAGATQ